MTATHPNPEFVEGPFFLLESTVHPHIGKRVVIWASDDSAARQVFGFKLALPLPYHILSYLGGLDDTKNSLNLSQAQLADLYRDGYVRL